MKLRIIILEFLILVLACGAAACSRRQSVNESNSLSSTPPTPELNWPELGPPVKVEPGILFHEVALNRAGATLRVWVYLPEHHEGTVPAILIAPAGSPLLYGKRLGAGDRPEHLPYVRAGFAVIAYDVEGAVGRGATESEIIKGAKAFEAAGYGVADARFALDYALARVPWIDPAKVIAAGHS
ncbi:MAG: hypothetical protein M3362_16290, partial [Acidobacteriota bacterium]|nr:hypothetical protein [Acidobacteriota bacterium]